jgi:hypothetical protein
MMGRLSHDQEQFFYSFRLEEAVSGDHPVREIAAVLDLSWVHSELAPYYSRLGRPCTKRTSNDGGGEVRCCGKAVVRWRSGRACYGMGAARGRARGWSRQRNTLAELISRAILCSKPSFSIVCITSSTLSRNASHAVVRAECRAR